LVDVTLPQGPAALRQALQAHPQILTYDYVSEMIAEMPAPTQQVMHAVVASAATAQQQLTASPLPSYGLGVASPSHASTSQPSATAAPNPAITQPAAQSLPLVASQPAAAAAAPAAAQAAAHHHHHNAQHHHLPTNMARVFKLQFDARRIICCSQTSVIVGWDFANGDEQIIEASRFFAPIE
jgi:F-box and WD-40 domain protein 1/11